MSGDADPIVIVYLAALHNSGSTIIALAANQHSQMVSPGEMIGPGGRFHDEEGPVCSCGEPIARCAFWQEVSKHYTTGGYPWAPAAWHLDYCLEGHPLLTKFVCGRPQPGALRQRIAEKLPWPGRRLAEFHERNVYYARCILDVVGKRVLLDASKHPERIAFLRRVSDIDLRVVHLLRDPRGWCNSRKKNYREPVTQTAQRWAERNAYIDRLCVGLPADRHIRVQYEAFCRDSQQVMEEIWELAGLHNEELPSVIRTDSCHLLGNRMRLQEEVRIEHDESWRDRLSKEEVATIRDSIGMHAKEYGYEL